MANGIKLVGIPASLMRDDLRRELPTGNRFVDCTNDSYADCRVIGLAGFLEKMSAWLCECKCGNQFIARGGILKYKGGWSCGCKRAMSEVSRPVAQIYQGILNRCFNPNAQSFHRYGGRGITMCRGWLNSVDAFAIDMGPRPSPKHSIDRRDNDGHYSCGKCVECRRHGWPTNCRWATAKEQVHNSTIPRMFTLDGVTRPMGDWGALLGITRERMRQRVNRCLSDGVDVSEALTTPAGETMPSYRNQYERYHLRISERNQRMVKDEWFDGNVHVVRQGVHWSDKISCETFRNIIQAEAEARGGKCKARILQDHIMFAYENKEAAVA